MISCKGNYFQFTVTFFLFLNGCILLSLFILIYSVLVFRYKNYFIDSSEHQQNMFLEESQPIRHDVACFYKAHVSYQRMVSTFYCCVRNYLDYTYLHSVILQIQSTSQFLKKYKTD